MRKFLKRETRCLLMTDYNFSEKKLLYLFTLCRTNGVRQLLMGGPGGNERISVRKESKGWAQ